MLSARKKVVSNRFGIIFGVIHREKGISADSAGWEDVDCRNCEYGVCEVFTSTVSGVTRWGSEVGRKCRLASSYNSRRAARRMLPLSFGSTCPPGKTCAFKNCEPSRAILSTRRISYESPFVGRARITLGELVNDKKMCLPGSLYGD